MGDALEEMMKEWDREETTDERTNDEKMTDERREIIDEFNDDEERDWADEERKWKEIEKEWLRKKREQGYAAKMRYERWKLEHVEAEQRALEWRAYWERRHKDDRDLWRNKDFANAVDKMSRAGYKGEHGNHEVPEEDKIKMHAMYMQATFGDYDGNDALPCAEEWKLLAGKTIIEAQNEFIHNTNKLLTRYGWNPPEGWI